MLFRMSNVAKNCTSTIIPAMRYRDALSMIAWLGRAFGFERRAVHMGEGDVVMHAELTFGNGMIMLGSVSNGTPSSSQVHQPEDAGFETQSPYLVVSDAEAIYATAKAEGAEMIMDLRTMEYGGKAFTCRDPERHVWSIGEYDPWDVS